MRCTTGFHTYIVMPQRDAAEKPKEPDDAGHSKGQTRTIAGHCDNSPPGLAILPHSFLEISIVKPLNARDQWTGPFQDHRCSDTCGPDGPKHFEPPSVEAVRPVPRSDRPDQGQKLIVRCTGWAVLGDGKWQPPLRRIKANYQKTAGKWARIPLEPETPRKQLKHQKFTNSHDSPPYIVAARPAEINTGRHAFERRILPLCITRKQVSAMDVVATEARQPLHPPPSGPP